MDSAWSSAWILSYCRHITGQLLVYIIIHILVVVTEENIAQSPREIKEMQYQYDSGHVERNIIKRI